MTALVVDILTVDDPLAQLTATRSLRLLLSVIEAEAVQAARSEGASWARVGQCLGVSKQAAAKRFAPPKTETATGNPPAGPVTDQARSRAGEVGWEVTTPGGRILLRLRKVLGSS